MSKVKIEGCGKESGGCVKKLIEQQVPIYKRLECDCVIPLFQGPILDLSNSGPWKSDLFVIEPDVYVCQLTSRASEDQWNSTLRIECLFEEGSKDVETFPAFQHFICKLVPYYEHVQPVFVMSENGFNPKTRVNEIRFHLKNCTLKNAGVQIFRDLSTCSGYIEPYKNSFEGLIKEFEDKISRVTRNETLLLSPQLDFGSANQKIIFSFWREDEIKWSRKSLWVTMYVINDQVPEVGPPFSLKVLVTIISQKHEGNNLVKKIVFPKEANKCEHSIFIALDSHLRNLGCLEYGTLCYRVEVEPFNFKLSEDLVKDSK